MSTRSVATAVVGLLAAGGLLGTLITPSLAEAFTSAAERVSSAAPTTVPVVEGSAAQQLESLPVKGRAPMTGYDPDHSFGSSWSDAATPSVNGSRDGCDTRNDVLRRDLTQTVIKPGTNGCVVLTGILHDPYGGTQIAWERGPQSAEVQVDHVVAKGNGWVTGAQQLSEQQRLDFANDPLNLLAVDGPLNSSKSDGDAATWLPPTKSYRCEYVARQIAVKDRYDLWVTAPEKEAMRRVLISCPDQPRADQSTSWKTPAPREGDR